MNIFTFSIVIPVYNGERFLRAAITSAIQQTRPADEIIVVDDASKDGSADIANSTEFKRRIKYYFNDTPTGFVDAWNRAVSKATGDFVTILHQDDLLHPEYLARIEQAVRKFTKVKHFYSACNYIDGSGLVIKEPPLPHALEPTLYSGADYAHNYLMGVISNNHIHRCPGVTTSRDLLVNICKYRKEAGLIADDDLFYRIGLYTDVVGISYPLASFRLHPESETAKADLTERLAMDYIYQAQQTKGDECIFPETDKQLIYRMSVKYINEFLFYRLLNNDKKAISKALKYATEIEDIIPGIMKLSLPAWAKIMWCFSRNGYLKTALGYVVLLDFIKKFKAS